MQGGRDESACYSVLQTLITTTPHASPAFSPKTNAQMLPLSRRLYYNQLAAAKASTFSRTESLIIRRTAMTHFAALLGVDWSDKKHDICLVDSATGKREASVLPHSPQAIAEWASALRTRYAGCQVAVCLEQSRGPLIYALMKYDFITLFPVNPRTLSKFREAFSPSRHKDDPPDAEYLAELLLHHRERLRAWQPDDEQTRTLRLLVEHRRRIVADRTRTSNRMTALLKCYFPQVLEWFPDIRTDLVCDFLLRWSSLDALKRVRRETLLKFFREHNSVRLETVKTLNV